jgi:hypothetical protein
MKADQILRKSATLLAERGKQRDAEDGERSMARAVKAFWEIYGDAITARGFMTETEGWEFMCFLKKSRKAHGVYNEDDYLDDVSYAALAAESEAKSLARVKNYADTYRTEMIYDEP